MLATVIIWCGAVLNVVLNWILIPVLSAVGAAIASLATEILILVLATVYTQKSINVLGMFPKYWKSLVSAGVMFGATSLMKNVSGSGTAKLLLTVFFGAVVYVGMEILLKDRVVTEGIEMVKEKIGKTGKGPETP